MMDVQTKRLELVKWILGIGEDILNKVDEIKETTSSRIVAYTVSGKPLTKEAYIKKVKDAESRIDSGEYITQEDLLKETQTW